MKIDHERYYVPEQSVWPIVGAISLFTIGIGAALLVNDLAKDQHGAGGYLLIIGLALLCYMLFGWFKNVIDESMAGLYSSQMDRSFRQGMSWFIFSEVMFFGAFFGALFYARIISVPWLDVGQTAGRGPCRAAPPGAAPPPGPSPPEIPRRLADGLPGRLFPQGIGLPGRPGA